MVQRSQHQHTRQIRQESQRESRPVLKTAGKQLNRKLASLEDANMIGLAPMHLNLNEKE